MKAGTFSALATSGSQYLPCRRCSGSFVVVFMRILGEGRDETGSPMYTVNLRKKEMPKTVLSLFPALYQHFPHDHLLPQMRGGVWLESPSWLGSFYFKPIGDAPLRCCLKYFTFSSFGPSSRKRLSPTQGDTQIGQLGAKTVVQDHQQVRGEWPRELFRSRTLASNYILL